MKNVKFSVIIPNYNNAQYITRAIKSVLVQTYENWELIIIDDGSTDDSLQKIHEFDDKRILLIANENRGVSYSRNVGLEKASGDYVIFIDSDDWIEPWLMEYINGAVEKEATDVFVGMFNTIKDSGGDFDCKSERILPENINGKTREEVLEHLYKLRLIFTVWRFVVKRDIITNKFVEGIIHEDEVWVPLVLANAKTFKAIPEPFYNYFIHSNSIMTSNNSLYRQDCLLKVARILFDISNNEKDENVAKFFLRCCYKNLFQAYLGVRELASPIEPIEDRFLK